MAWQLRHEGSPQVLKGLTLPQIVEGLRDGIYDGTDEVLGPGEVAWTAIENHPDLAEVAEEVDVPTAGRHEEATSLDMNALIDVCLVLLIFFILTTSYVAIVQKVVPLSSVRSDKEGVKRLPPDYVKTRMVRVQAILDKSGKKEVRIENQASDVLTPDGRVDPDKVKAALQPYTKGEDRKTEILLDAEGVTWDDVIQIQDGARAAGIQSVKHLTRKR